MRPLSRLLPLAALFAFVAACSDTTTVLAPADADALAEAQAELATAAADLPDVNDTDPALAPQPLLLRLTARALARLDRLGADEAKARMIEALREAQRALQAAIEGGDPEQIRAAMHARDVTASRIVIAVFTPRIVPEVIHMVGQQVRALKDRIDQAEADGRDVTGPRRVLAAVISRLEEARRLNAAGNHVAALIVATHAADFLHTMFHR
ncbi:MAG: hypothetical protein OEW77_09765 [Gemmatimonadota bacterium]|nr:hypothetical protein [Gemmatimonadota bacterium]